MSWGDTTQVDFTFSAAKSYLSMLAGIAVMDGLIRDLDEPVGRTVHDGGFEGPHNSAISWRQLLQNTSEWEGTLFGKSDVIDRNRNLAVEGKGRKGDPRPLQRPGEFWEYNDVRVNRLSLALLRRFGRPLPRYSLSASCTRLVHRRIGPGTVTEPPASRLMASGSNWYPVARTGAVECSFTPRIRHDWAF